MTLRTRIGKTVRRLLASPERRRVHRQLRQLRPLIVLDIEMLGLWDQCAPVAERLLTGGECVVAVVVANREPRLAALLHELRELRQRLVYLPRDRYFALDWVPAVTLSLHAENGSELARRLAKGPTQRVVMQHGLSDKTAFAEIDRSDPLADFDAVFLSGPAFREGSLHLYAEKHPKTISRLRFFEIGSPKTDALFNGRWRREDVLAGLGLDPTLPTVCYAPTWEKWASLETDGLEIMATLADLEVNTIVKLHHASLDTSNTEWVLRDGHGGHDWRALVSGIERSSRRLRLAPGADATPFMIASDIMVSDASGAAYEFVLQDRPVIFFDTPDLFDHYGRSGIHYWGRACGDIVGTMDELRHAVLLNIAEPGRNAQARREWIGRISFARGDATERAVRAILDLARQPRISQCHQGTQG
jgi:hypothetical protein